MSQTATVAETDVVLNREAQRAPAFGIALVSFGSLLLELSLTRLFSVVLFYHFAFLAISIALLGLGAGGVFAYLARKRLAAVPARKLGAWLCMANAIAIVAVLWVVLHQSVSISLTWANFKHLTYIYLASGVPFFLTGLLFSVVFARESGRIGQLYGADLVGGSAACLAVVPALDLVGGPNAVLLAAVAMVVAAWMWAQGRSRKTAAALTIVMVILVAANYRGKLFDVVYAKGMRRDQPWMEFARWNAISRVEVDDQGGAKVIVIDADASTYIMNLDPHRIDDTGWKQPLMAAPSAAVNLLRPHGKFAIIGPGGGVDVLRAVASGSPDVTGIEINPIIADTIMRGRYAEYAHHLYELPEVHIHVSDGRSWIRASRERYDVVEMTLVDTWASTAAGAFALSENNLYTVQAFEAYFQHLKSDGIIAITRWEFKQPREALRVASEEMEAMRRLGIGTDAPNLADHFVVLSDGPLDEDGRPVTVFAKRSPFTGAEIATILRDVERNPNLYILWAPGVSSDCFRDASTPACSTISLPGTAGQTVKPRFAAATAAGPFVALVHTGSATAPFVTGYRYNIAPVSDDRPFFFFTIRLSQVLRGVLHGEKRGMDWAINLGTAVLLIVLALSVAAVLFFILGPLAVYAPARRQNGWRLLYFVAIGVGYILVEIAFIQRFVLFLGHPTYALTVVVFLMLLSSGVGSMVARRWLQQALRVRLPLGLIVVAILALVVLLPVVLTDLVGLPFLAKLAISGSLLVPLGFLMGMPFPTGLRALGSAAEAGTDENGIEWAWALNAAASVLGSVLAITVAIFFGLSVTLACGAAAYLAASALAGTFRTSAP